ncbi:hypothetical protein LC087_15810 [Bacillus carboniphilus]|uniref:YqkK n=1 Tax=Bacillus carboniphilus TaxID=86663 RepID=A0ABY9JTV9_9BACI|nr:hypothetical protein [Bacillus carboniphilus]WLR42188.1 hypothetical protein LC087_15810 [Bacillus carboniphilus]
MAKSKAKKLRDKLGKQGKRNPETGRSPYAFTDMRTRKTKTKKDKLYANKFKGRSSHTNYDGDGCPFLVCFC